MKNFIFFKKIDHNSLSPQRANDTDAGYDIFAHSGPRIVGKMAENSSIYWKSISYIEYGSGLIFQPVDKSNYLQLYPRSSISNYNLILANSCGIIDPLFQKEILIRFKYTPQPEDYVIDNDRIYININMSKIYEVGNKIAQIIPSKIMLADLVEVDKIEETDRAGFGSTGI